MKVRSVVVSVVAAGILTVSQPVWAQAHHTNPLNLDPSVREGFARFYDLDYDGALQRFDRVEAAHPEDPMAVGYQLLVTLYRELYRQDLLDTTYYAHDSFIFNKRETNVSPAARQRIEELTNKAVDLAERRLRVDPKDKDALFARGYAKGMHASFATLVDHSFSKAAKEGLSSRTDSEEVLKIDPDYVDAKMAMGIQQFAVASLPRLVRIMVGIFGVGGNKEKGLVLLRDCAARGTVTSVESRTALSLFLRHDGRYGEALSVTQTLVAQYPHDYLFRLEEANLLKDGGTGMRAVDSYRAVIADAHKNGYFIEPRLHMAYYGLAEAERGQNLIHDAADHYLAAASAPAASDWVKKRAQLNAGQMLDLLGRRDDAVRQYQLASAPVGDQSQADEARKYLKKPFKGK
ncbi:MAG: hypothetical protein JF584_08820 [Acidobacteria bacterium]|nr:hypothetical protein [Acidobacteriota bacterium]